MALTKDREIDHYVDQELRTLQMTPGKHIFKGAFVGLNRGGCAEPLCAGNLFAGIAYEEMNATGKGAGDLSIRIYTLGDFGLTLDGVRTSDIGHPVYGVDDAAITMFQSGNLPYVGFLVDAFKGNNVILRLDTFRQGPQGIRYSSSGVDC